ncbi:MAG: RNA polymerase sporulation sigma factor SigG [Clostridia bacterium]|nr:RNA polymerase sporulation sigma factor SigG [Clostridia bacterium]
MYFSKVDLCGVNTSALKVLKAEEMDVLLKKSKEGDKTARNLLIDGNLRLVLSIIQRFSGRGENMDDLFQVGCIGLIKAVDNFNTDLDVKFSTYAVPMIIGEVRRYLRDNNTIRVSRSVRDLAYRALQARERLAAQMEREPRIEEITAELNKERPQEHREMEEVASALDAIVAPLSLFEPIYSDASSGDSVYLMDQLSDPVGSDESWLESIALKDALSHLSDREKSIISMRFFSGRTQMEVASEIGISQAQVSRLEKNALTKIRRYF